MKLNFLARGAALTALSTAALSGLAFGQETTSAVRGEVTDAGGAPIAGAEVTITHVPTGATSVETTGPSGIFDLRGLRVGGPYTIEVEAPDYQGERVENVFLTLGAPYRIVVDLDPSEEEIVVVAMPTAVTDVVGTATVLSRDDIDGAVSVTRDIRDLARRDPLVSQHVGGNNGGISIAGSNPRTNRITIDGVQAQDDFGLNTGGLPTRRGPVSLDSVRQFSVEAAPFDVENGDFLGGAINVVLREGGNDFEGSAFVNYLNEGLVGTRIDGRRVTTPITQDNWGGTFRGPIIPNTLFFALSYETYESADPTSTGPAGAGFASTITGPTGAPMTQAQIDAVTNVFANTYGSTFPFGEITNSKPITDEKYTARLDWDITDDHRASFTYRSSESGIIQRTNLSSTSAGLDSQWYLTGEDDETYSLQVNSDWTSNFSTELRVSMRDYTRLQEPPAGQNFADIRVCSTQTTAVDTGTVSPHLNCRLGNTTVASVRFGPDQFRHANYLVTGNDQVQFSGEYQLGRHLFKAGVQWQNTDIYNIFLPNSDGTYYFDSIDNFAAGLASQLIYRNAISGDPNDAAGIFDYDVYTLFVQDSWDVTTDLTLNYGLRWDTYSVNAAPALNPNFSARYPGRTNQETYDGRDVLMPRVSFTYDATDDLRISGGVGLFSGGLPDVFLSNVFSNTGIIDNTLQFERLATGVLTETTGAVNCAGTTPIYGGFTGQQVCSDALNVPVNPTFGTSIPASVQAALGGTTASPTSETNIISPDFEIPSDWKANISLGWDVAEGWRLGFDAVGIRTNEGLAFRDIRAVPLIVNGVQALTPDGRIRYNGLSSAQVAAATGAGLTITGANPGSNRDIEAFNPGEQTTSFAASLSVSKEWSPNLTTWVAYGVQDFEEYSASARFSSTANSLYSGQFAALDPNTATVGRSQEEIEENFKFGVDWRRAFVGELETRFSLFGEIRSGRPVTFTMSDSASGRGAVFGVNRVSGGRQLSQLAYIPDLTSPTSDPLVAYSGTAYADLVSVVQRFNIPTGGIVPRGSFRNPDVEQVDLQISQDIPALFQGNRARLTFDIANVLNLLNDEWGVVEEFPEDVRLFNVACADASGVASNLGAVTCQRYLISSVNTTQTSSLTTDESRWVIQIGLRYEF
ncbi:MAG: TonB-dependent receptor [Hydrogenophilaceae bacterium]|jgi:outer membrane receptor protein involved in Fe transport|nr:TonB-dependent receptor [Hydrogenophilaceae bacterium]